MYMYTCYAHTVTCTYTYIQYMKQSTTHYTHSQTDEQVCTHYACTHAHMHVHTCGHTLTNTLMRTTTIHTCANSISPHTSSQRMKPRHQRQWLGLENMHLLTNLSGLTAQLRVDLADWEGNTAFAKYDQFSVAGEDSDYTLSVSGYQNASTAGGALTFQVDSTTKTVKGSAHLIETMMPGVSTAYAVYYHGPWWHNHCYHCMPPDWQVLHKWRTLATTVWCYH